MSDTVLTPMPEPVRRCEIFTGEDRRRRWSAEAKRAILAECEREGETVCGVARRHGLMPSQLFWWKRQAREAAQTAPARKRRNDVGFAPVVVAPEGWPAGDCGIEIASGSVVVRVRREADVKLLGPVLQAIRASGV